MVLNESEIELINIIRKKKFQTVRVKVHEGKIVHVVVEESIKLFSSESDVSNSKK